MDVTRRRLVGLGAAGAVGTIVGQVATPGSRAAAATRLGGIHVYCLLKGVSPGPFFGFPYSVMLTVWGTDDALNGSGWGATVEGGDPAQSYLGASVASCIFAAQGSVDDDIVRMKATQIFTGHRADQGMPWLIEADLASGFVRGVEVNAEMGTELVFEGQGVVSRI